MLNLFQHPHGETLYQVQGDGQIKGRHALKST